MGHWIPRASRGYSVLSWRIVARRDHQQVSKVSRALPLAFLAPDIVALIVEGRQPPALTAERLIQRRRPLPMDWGEQRALFLR